MYQITTNCPLYVQILCQCLVIMSILWWNFDAFVSKIKRKLGFKYQPGYVALPQVASDEDVEEERPPESPPHLVVTWLM